MYDAEINKFLTEVNVIYHDKKYYFYIFYKENVMLVYLIYKITF